MSSTRPISARSCVRSVKANVKRLRARPVKPSLPATTDAARVVHVAQVPARVTRKPVSSPAARRANVVPKDPEALVARVDLKTAMAVPASAVPVRAQPTRWVRAVPFPTR